MEPNHQEPVMTSTPLVYRCGKRNNIEVSPIFPVTGRKIKSMVPTFTCLDQPAAHGRRKTDSEYINKGVDIKEANRETSALKLKRPLSLNQENVQPPGKRDIPDKRVSSINIFKTTEEFKSINLDWHIPEETKKISLSRTKGIHQHLKVSDVPSSKPNVEDDYNQHLNEETGDEMSPLDVSYPPKKKQRVLKNENQNKTPYTIIVKDTVPNSPCTDNNRASNTYVLIEQDEKASLNEPCRNSKRKGKQTRTNTRQKRMKTDDVIEGEQINLVTEARTEQKKVDEGKDYNEVHDKCDESVSYSKATCKISKKTKKIQESLVTRADEKKYNKCNSDVQLKKTNVMKNKKVTSNKGNAEETLTKMACPKSIKREVDDIMADEQINISADTRTETKASKGKDYVDMSDKCDKSVKTIKTEKVFNPGSNEKKCVEANEADAQLKQLTFSVDDNLSSNKENCKQTLKKIPKNRIKKESNGVKEVKRTKIPINAGTDAKANEVKDYDEIIQHCGSSVSSTKPRRRVSRTTTKPQESLKTKTNEENCIEGNSGVQLENDAKANEVKNYDEIGQNCGRSVSSTKPRSRISKTTTKPQEFLKTETNKENCIDRNSGVQLENDAKANEIKDYDEISQHCGRSVPSTKPRRRISRTATKPQESLKTETNEKNCIEGNSGVQLENVQSTSIKDAKVTQIKNCVASENKEGVDCKIIPIENSPMSCTVVIDNPLEKRSCKKSQDTKSGQLKTSQFSVKREGLRNKSSTNPTETIVKTAGLRNRSGTIPTEAIVNEITNNMKNKASIISESQHNGKTESDRPSDNPTVEIIDVKSCFESKKDLLMSKEGAVVHVFIHISEFVMTGSSTVHPGGSITKASTNTTYFVVSGAATVRLGPLTKVIHSQDVNCSFFIPKHSDFAISNEESIDLKMFFTKFSG